MEDLEVNLLYRAFLTKFKREFEIACKMSYLIAIPQSSVLEGFTIDQYFANSHILMPSKLLKMHYNPMQVGNFERIELDNGKLLCHQKVAAKRQQQTDQTTVVVTVKILAEEIGYNIFSKEYRTILIDKPLVPGNSDYYGSDSSAGPMVSFRAILAPLSPRSQMIAQVAKKQRAQLISCRMLSSHDDCAKYLECISQELTHDLENDIKQLQGNYVTMAPYLEEIAQEARSIVESYIDRYESSIASSQPPFGIPCEGIQKSIRLSVENYVVHLMHGKLSAAMHKCYEKEDTKLQNKFNLMLRSNLSLCQLGAQAAFSDFNLSDELTRKMKRLPNLASPLSMVTCLLEMIDLISASLAQSVEFRRLLGADGGLIEMPPSRASEAGSVDRQTGSSQYWARPTPICSDDLIASLVFCLPRARPNNLYSAIRYLELFGWSSVDKDQASYYLATFESSVEYILRFNDGGAADVKQSNYGIGTTKICSEQRY